MSIDTQIAVEFGQAVARGDFTAAHALLSKEARESHSPDAMKREVAAMTAYAEGPIQHAEVMDDFVLDDWPGKQDGDIAWVYVALVGDSFSEAVSVVLTTTAEGIRIRELEWGRP